MTTIRKEPVQMVIAKSNVRGEMIMREIKFRAWDKQNNVMCDVELLGESVLKIKGGEWENREDFIVMQVSGLKDKHGREIYEGDILSHTVEIVETDGSVEVAECYYEALFRQGCFLTRTLDGCYPEYETFADRFSICQGVNMLSDGETIGNIYENPELLEAGDGP